MAKEYRIKVYGEQREVIDPDLMARLVVMLGRQLAEDAKQAAEAAHAAHSAVDDRDAQDADSLYRHEERRRKRRSKADGS